MPLVEDGSLAHLFLREDRGNEQQREEGYEDGEENDVLKSRLHFLRLTTRVMFCSSKTVLRLLKSALFTGNFML